MVGSINGIVYASGTAVMITTIVATLISSVSAQQEPSQDPAQANFTVIYTNSFGGILPTLTTISYDSQNNTIISNREQRIGGFEPSVNTSQLTEQQEQELRTLIEPIISSNYQFVDDTCPTPSACNQSSLRVTIGTEPPKTIHWTPYSTEIINQLNNIESKLVSSNSTT